MTREELEMRTLVRESDVIDRTDGSELAKAFNYLWEKYVEQEPCEDAISRQAAIKAITNTSGIRGDALNALYDLPPVNPTNTGHWISHYDEDAKEGWYECDRCHTERAFNTDYCPDCGARMVEPQERSE